jgi:hypothetical protein
MGLADPHGSAKNPQNMSFWRILRLWLSLIDLRAKPFGRFAAAQAGWAFGPAI